MQEKLLGSDLYKYLMTTLSTAFIPTAWYISHESGFEASKNILIWYVFAALVDYIGQLADTTSTNNVFRAVGIQDNNSIEVYEANPLYPAQPSEKDLTTGKSLYRSVNEMASGIIFPPLGIIYGIYHLVLASGNEKLRQKLLSSTKNE